MYKNYKTLLISFSFLALFWPGMAHAETETLNSPNSNNLTIAGDNVYINDPIDGDLIVAGGSVMVNADISGDILGAAGNIDIKGDVAGDVRIATGNFKLDGSIAGDLVAFAGEISISEDSSIGQDVHISAGQITLNGSIDGVVNIAAGNVQINGNIGDSVKMAAENISIGEDAMIDGDLEYISKIQISEIQKHVKGKVRYQESPLEDGRTVMEGIAQGINIFWMIAALFTGMMLLIFLPTLPVHATRNIKKGPFISYFTGILAYLSIFPIIIAMVTGIGLHIGFSFLLLWIMMITFSKLFVSIVLGEWLLQGLQLKPTSGKRFVSLAVAILILATVGMLPYINVFILLVLMPLCMGAVVRTLPSIFKVVRSLPGTEGGSSNSDNAGAMTTNKTATTRKPAAKKPAPRKRTARKPAAKKPSTRSKSRSSKKK